jgi:CubicO group peptidase (beta-lactamase class C family)
VRLTADTALRSPSGATFTAAAGWFVTEAADHLRLQDPTKEVRLTLVELVAPDGQAAIQAAWKRVSPGFARAVLKTVTPPARDGWEAVVQNVYQVPEAEQRVVVGLARRKGKTWYVALIDGTQAGFDRRSAQTMLVITSFKVAGLDEESFAGKTAHPLDAARQKALADFVAEAMQKTKVPGVAVAVVQGGKIVYEQGFGVRQLGKPAKVTPATRFMIGSTTKALTSLLIARLVDEGKLTWDTPVTQLYPAFALGDPEATRRITMKHTVCACTGLPRQDMEFIFQYAGITAEQRLAAMRTMKPTTGFGETFQYSNLLVSTGGFVAGRCAFPKARLMAGYDQALRTRILGPLGMKDTTFDPSVARRGDHAVPHGMTMKLDYVPIPFGDEGGVTAVGPAGAAWSTVRDLARYVLLELGKGRAPEGKEIVSEKNLLARREVMARINAKVHYGLGLMVNRAYGTPLVGHGGNTLGFTADLWFLPEHGVGLVILVNGVAANTFRSVVGRRLLELLFDGRDQARSALDFAVAELKTSLERDLPRIDLVPDPAWLKPLLGTYQNADLGQITLRMQGKTAVLDAGEWKATAGRYRDPDGTQKLLITGPPLTGMHLVPETKDGRTTLTLRTPQQVYVFTRTKP